MRTARLHIVPGGGEMLSPGPRGGRQVLSPGPREGRKVLWPGPRGEGGVVSWSWGEGGVVSWSRGGGRGRKVLWPGPRWREVLWPGPGGGGVVTWSMVVWSQGRRGGRCCHLVWGGGVVTWSLVAHLPSLELDRQMPVKI